MTSCKNISGDWHIYDRNSFKDFINSLDTSYSKIIVNKGNLINEGKTYSLQEFIQSFRKMVAKGDNKRRYMVLFRKQDAFKNALPVIAELELQKREIKKSNKPSISYFYYFM